MSKAVALLQCSSDEHEVVPLPGLSSRVWINLVRRGQRVVLLLGEDVLFSHSYPND